MTIVPRRRIKIKVSEIRQLAALQPTHAEAAAFFGIAVTTWRRMLKHDKKAAQAWEEGAQVGKTSLRRKQFRLAETNSSMAIFLGKQYLGQTDVVVNEVSGRDGGPIKQTLDFSKLDASERNRLRDIVTRARKDGSGRGPSGA